MSNQYKKWGEKTGWSVESEIHMASYNKILVHLGSAHFPSVLLYFANDVVLRTIKFCGACAKV